jgi:hypothetical protein
MFEWLLALGLVALFLAALPRILRRTKSSLRKNGGSGMVVAIGIAFSAIFDPKSTQAMEIVETKKDIGDSEAGESGEKP